MTPKPGSVSPPKTGQFKRHGARVLDSQRHDPYRPRGKLPPTRCDRCGAYYAEGRWQWRGDATATLGTCPACRRIADRMPAGHVTLAGPYVGAHQQELVSIANHEAQAESADHPLHRIMTLDARGDAIDISTTDLHLPCRIGRALQRAHDGELSITFSEDAYEVRVEWRR